MLNDKICYFNKGKEKLEVKNNIVYVNGTKINRIGSGVDGSVYKYKDKAIKLYHDTKHIKTYLNKYQINLLSNISTEHIILPQAPLEHPFTNPGFIMKYIDLKTKQDILTSPIEQVIKELEEIEQELILLGKNHFLLDDIKSSNTFYDKTLYLFDPDSFIYDKQTDFSNRNIEMFIWQFIRDCIFSKNNELTKREQLSMVRRLHYLYKIGNYKLLSVFIKEISNKDPLENIRKTYIRKKY